MILNAAKVVFPGGLHCSAVDQPTGVPIMAPTTPVIDPGHIRQP
jgi:hypothetical protein